MYLFSPILHIFAENYFSSFFDDIESCFDDLNLKLGGTTITAIIAGKMMPENVKKILHPLLFATFISAIAAVLSDRFIGGADKKLLSGKSQSWVESLYTYTSPGPSTAPPCSTSLPIASIPCPPSSSSITDMRIGDLFALILGPACTALAFRIFSNSEKLHSKLPAILTASAVAAVTSLFVSPLLGSIVGIPSELNNALAHVRKLPCLTIQTFFYFS